MCDAFSVGVGTDQVDNFTAPATLGANLYHSQSNPDITMSLCYDEMRDFPEHVLKVTTIDISIFSSINSR